MVVAAKEQEGREELGGEGAGRRPRLLPYEQLVAADAAGLAALILCGDEAIGVFIV